MPRYRKIRVRHTKTWEREVIVKTNTEGERFVVDDTIGEGAVIEHSMNLTRRTTLMPQNELNISHALTLWHEGAAYYASLPVSEPREEAIVAGVAYLQRFVTMQELLTAYYSESADKVLEAAMTKLQAQGVILNWGICEDVAYWRRYQELVTGSHDDEI